MSKASYKFLKDLYYEMSEARKKSPHGLVRCVCHEYTGIATAERVNEYTEFTVVTQTDYHIGDVIHNDLDRPYNKKRPWHLIRCSSIEPEMESYCRATIVKKRVYDASKEKDL